MMTDAFTATVTAIARGVAGPGTPEQRLQQVMQLVHDRHPHYEWVGLYLLRGDELHLGPYVGAPTEHTRIAVGKGVCGTAIAERRNQLIRDVRELDNYLACSATVRSEIVVLIFHEGRLLGQIDADCDDVGAFTASDEEFLEHVAATIAPLVARV